MFALSLPNVIVEELVAKCWTVGLCETGGILAGQYTCNHSVAEVTEITGPPPDSRAGRTWFVRGVKGVGAWLGKLWKKNQYYLGEWHFHPSAAPEPSKVDIEQMRKIASAAQCHCPEPILLVVGGDKVQGFRFRAFVSPRDGNFKEIFVNEAKAEPATNSV